jgi:hypothetical protein
MLLREKCRRLIAGLSQNGPCFAREDWKRDRIGRLYGRKPGEKSVGRSERAASKFDRFGPLPRTLFRRERRRPGDPIPWGSTSHGCALVWMVTRQQRRAAARARATYGERKPSSPRRPTPRPRRDGPAPSSPRPRSAIVVGVTATLEDLDPEALERLQTILAGGIPAPPTRRQ